MDENQRNLILVAGQILELIRKGGEDNLLKLQLGEKLKMKLVKQREFKIWECEEKDEVVT